MQKRDVTSEPELADLAREPLPPEKSEELLSEMGRNFAYGPGLGCTAINVGTAVVFPPYAALLLTNAVLTFSGYETLSVTNLLPEEGRDGVNEVHEQVCSVPGRVNAAVSGEQYRDRAEGKEILRNIYTKPDNDRKIPADVSGSPPEPEFLE